MRRWLVISLGIVVVLIFGLSVAVRALFPPPIPEPPTPADASADFHINEIDLATSSAMFVSIDNRTDGPLVVVQDRLNVHKAVVSRWLAGRPPDAPRVMVEWLPSYAPELNPAEQLWNNGKRVDLANFAPTDRDDLRSRVRRSLIRQQCCPNLLASAFDHAGLPL